MLQNNELIALLIAMLVLIFLMVFRRSISGIPCVRFLIYAFIYLFASLLSTIIEDYLWPQLFNLLEHVFNLFSTAFLVLWLWVLSRKSGHTE